MTWHLKDRELERKLNKFSDGKFSRILNEHTGPNESDCIVLELGKNNNIELSVYIPPEAIEEIPDYNPKGWNNYPEVTPPYDVMMRIKMKNGYLRAGYLKKFPDGDSWVNPNGVLMWNAENAEIELFRPWED